MYNKYGSSMPKDRQVRTLCKDFIMKYLYGSVVDCMDATRRMDEIWGVRVDWHEMSYALDELHTIGEIKIDQPGGFCELFHYGIPA